jgi:hypothetical protein
MGTGTHWNRSSTATTWDGIEHGGNNTNPDKCADGAECAELQRRMQCAKNDAKLKDRNYDRNPWWQDNTKQV